MLFTNKGIPVIITEVGMMSELKKENNFMREFLYVLFSITVIYDGIMSCLWDISEKIGEDIYYYNKETNQQKDKKIIDNLNNISKLKYVQISEFYIETNLVTEAGANDGCLMLNLEKRKPIKIFINMRLTGYLDIDIDLSVYFSSIDSNNNSFITFLEKKDGKKEYDGTTLFTKLFLIIF